MALKLINTENLDTLADKMTARTGTEGKLVFPEGFNNEVDEKLFSRKKWIQLLGGNSLNGELEELTADDTRGVTILRENAFMSIYSLKRATIHSDVKTLYWACFRSCKNLKEFIIKDGGTTHFDSHVFNGCTSLERVDLTSYGEDKTLPTLRNVNSFDGTPSTLKIVVPYGRRLELSEMTNWSSFADRIYSQAVDFLIGTWQLSKNFGDVANFWTVVLSLGFKDENGKTYNQIEFYYDDRPIIKYHNQSGEVITAFNGHTWTSGMQKITIESVGTDGYDTDALYNYFLEYGCVKE